MLSVLKISEAIFPFPYLCALAVKKTQKALRFTSSSIQIYTETSGTH